MLSLNVAVSKQIAWSMWSLLFNKMHFSQHFSFYTQSVSSVWLSLACQRKIIMYINFRGWTISGLIHKSTLWMEKGLVRFEAFQSVWFSTPILCQIYFCNLTIMIWIAFCCWKFCILWLWPGICRGRQHGYGRSDSILGEPHMQLHLHWSWSQECWSHETRQTRHTDAVVETSRSSKRVGFECCSTSWGVDMIRFTIKILNRLQQRNDESLKMVSDNFIPILSLTLECDLQEWKVAIEFALSLSKVLIWSTDSDWLLGCHVSKTVQKERMWILRKDTTEVWEDQSLNSLPTELSAIVL